MNTQYFHDLHRNFQNYRTNDKNEINDLLNTIRLIDELNISQDKESLLTALAESRNELCDRFLEICEKIETIDGVKKIDHTIKYYGNGLVEIRRSTTRTQAKRDSTTNFDLQMKTFDYSSETKDKQIAKQINKNISYRQMFRDGEQEPSRKDYDLYLLPGTATWLINDYIKSFMHEKPSKHKINYHKTKQIIQKFNETLPENLSEQTHDIMYFTIEQEIKTHKNIVETYIKALNYCLNGRYIKKQCHPSQKSYANKGLYYCANLYQEDWSDHNGAKCITPPAEYLANSIFTDIYNNIEYPETLRTSTYYKGSTQGYIDRSQLPYINEADAKQFLEIYQTIFNKNINSEDCDISQQAERLAKDDAYDFYVKCYKTQNIKQPNRFYENHGYLSMLFDYKIEKDEIICVPTIIQSYCLSASVKYNVENNTYDFYNKIHQEIVKSAETMLININILMDSIKAIPNESLQAFMKKNKIL